MDMGRYLVSFLIISWNLKTAGSTSIITSSTYGHNITSLGDLRFHGNLIRNLTSSHYGKIIPLSLPLKDSDYMIQTEIEVQVKRQTMEKEASFLRLLVTLIDQNLHDCDLIILYNGEFKYSPVIEFLIKLPNCKQIVLIESPEDLEWKVMWKNMRCHGILLLIDDAEPLIDFATREFFRWDYRSKMIIGGLSHEDIDRFIETREGKKIENILAVLETDPPGHFNLYMNELYWGQRGLRLLTRWKGQSFSVRKDFYPDKIIDLQQTLFDVAVFEWQPAILYRRDKDGNILIRYGRDVEVVKALAEIFNFTFVYKETNQEELFGFLLPNGSYNGQVGQMHRGEADLGIANLWIASVARRHEFQEYSAPFEIDTSCILARVDPPLPLWHSPALPFQAITWGAIFISLVLSGPVLYVLARMSETSGFYDDPGFASYQIVFLYSFGVHLNIPIAVLPSRPPMQIFTTFFWLYSIIITTGYTANLIAFLTVPRQPKSVETFEELYKSGLIFVGSPYHRDAIAFSKNPFLRAMVETYKVEFRFDDFKDDILNGVGVTLDSKHYLGLLGGILTARGKKPKFRIMKECFAFYSVGIAYQKHSPLKQRFDIMITRMFDSGIVNRWFYDAIDVYTQYERLDALEEENPQHIEEVEAESGLVNLSMEHTEGLFILMLCGCFLGTIIFGFEHIIAPNKT